MRVRLVVEKVRLTVAEGELVADRATVPVKEPWVLTVIVEVKWDLPF